MSSMKSVALSVFHLAARVRVPLVAGVALLSVNLGGCVAALFGAGATTGVAVVQERSVGSALDDSAIQIAVQGKMIDHSGKLFLNVATEVDEGRVLLTGVVRKTEDRVAAARIAWDTNGVAEVLNEIQVTDKSGIINYTKDAWITTKLRTKMLGDSKIVGINYTIETVNAVVYLLGVAQDATELNRVTEHARNIGGVTEVVSHVRYKDDPRRH
jgi:osmotically-inducible protein OsmY